MHSWGVAQVERSIFYLLLVFLIGTPLVITTYVGPNEIKWFLVRTVGTSLFFGWLIIRVWQGQLKIRWDPIAVLSLVFCAIQALSLLVATNPWSTLTEVSKMAGLLCVYFLVANIICSRTDRDRVLMVVAAVGFLTSLYGIAQHWGYDFFPWQEHRQVPISRGVSFFGHATFSASVLIMAIPLTVGLACTRRRPISVIIVLGMALTMLYHLSFSGARTATVSLLTAALATGAVGIVGRRSNAHPGLLQGMNFRRILLISCAFLLVAATGIVMLLRASSVKDSDLFAIRQNSLALRLYTWETATRMFLAHPLTGTGAGNYSIVSPAYWNRVESHSYARHGRRAHEVHNEYLEVAAELGLPGIVVMLGLTAFALSGSYALSHNSSDNEHRRVALAYFAAIFAASLDATMTYIHQLPGSAMMYRVVLGLISYELWSRSRSVEGGQLSRAQDAQGAEYASGQ